MANTVKINKGIERLAKIELTAPSIYELSLLPPDEQKKRVNEWLKENGVAEVNK